MMRNRWVTFSTLFLVFLALYAFLKKVYDGVLPYGGAISDPITDTIAIDELTREDVVVPYVRMHKKLPDYYVTKSEARKRGWIASEGNLCEVLPGKAIGGDVFANREGQLPKAAKRVWYEADLNYRCGRRNAHRLLYSNDGLIYVTYDHYKNFEKR